MIAICGLGIPVELSFMLFRDYLSVFKVVPLWIGLMSGLASIIREVAVLYGQANPLWNRQLFWSCVWITSIVALVLAWILKQQELTAEKQKSGKPGFNVEALKIAATPLILPREKYKIVGSKFFVRMYFSQASKASSIRNFGLEIVGNGEAYSIDHAEAGSAKMYPSKGLGDNGEENHNLQQLVNSTVVEAGQGKEGFLAFCLMNVLPRQFKRGVGIVYIRDATNNIHRSKGVEIQVFEDEV
jgi:hypothetical protein